MSELKYRYRIRYHGHVSQHYYTIEDIENHKELNKESLRDASAEILSRDRYTGSNINGVEIYEGDFLEGSESGEFGSTLATWVDVVVWGKEKAAFVCMDLAGGILGLDETDSDTVIGNIYTHPEWLRLIKKEFDALRGDKK